MSSDMMTAIVLAVLQNEDVKERIMDLANEAREAAGSDAEVDVSNVDGLDDAIDARIESALNEHMNDHEVDADNVKDLDEAIDARLAEAEIDADKIDGLSEAIQNVLASTSFNEMMTAIVREVVRDELSSARLIVQS